MTKHNFEERVKFDYGFTIGKLHPVRLVKDGAQVRLALVHIPNRGRPRAVIKTNVTTGLWAINTYIIDGDDLVYLSHTTRPYAVEEFDALTTGPDLRDIEF
jgi:hypothetical protein